MRKPHILKKNARIEIKNRWIFFDCESTVSYRDELVEKQKLRLGYALYVRMDSVKKVQRECPFYDTAALGAFILDCTASKTVLTVASLNLPFDYALSGIGDYLSFMGFRLRTIIFNQSTCVMKYRKGAASIVLIDVFNYIKTSVAALGDMVGLPKLEIDFSTCSDDELMAYCMRDVAVIAQFMVQYINFIREHELGSMGFTTPSQAFNAFRHRFMHHDIYIHNLPGALVLERDGYFGGRTECYRLGRIEGPIHVLDINSQYPYVMRVNNYPVKLLHYRKNGLPLPYLKAYLEKYCVTARVTVETDVPVYAAKIDNKLVFPIGRFDTVLSSAGLRYAFEHDHITDCKEAAVFQGAPIFSEYVDYFYRARQMYGANGNKPYRDMVKLFLNSLYGKFGQKRTITKYIGRDPLVKNGIRDYWDMMSGIRYREIIINYDTFLERRTDNESINSFPAIAAHVTEYARFQLWEIMEQAGRENVYYVDTDSLFVNDTGMVNLRPAINENRLGALKIEKTWDSVDIRGLKDYHWPGGDKIKGIKKSATRIDDNTFIQTHWPTMRSIVKGGLTGEVTLNTVTKHLSREYAKGTVAADGTVEPYRL